MFEEHDYSVFGTVCSLPSIVQPNSANCNPDNGVRLNAGYDTSTGAKEIVSASAETDNPPTYPEIQRKLEQAVRQSNSAHEFLTAACDFYSEAGDRQFYLAEFGPRLRDDDYQQRLDFIHALEAAARRLETIAKWIGEPDPPSVIETALATDPENLLIAFEMGERQDA